MTKKLSTLSKTTLLAFTLIVAQEIVTSDASPTPQESTSKATKGKRCEPTARIFQGESDPTTTKPNGAAQPTQQVTDLAQKLNAAIEKLQKELQAKNVSLLPFRSTTTATDALVDTLATSDPTVDTVDLGVKKACLAFETRQTERTRQVQELLSKSFDDFNDTSKAILLALRKLSLQRKLSPNTQESVVKFLRSQIDKETASGKKTFHDGLKLHNKIVERFEHLVKATETSGTTQAILRDAPAALSPQDFFTKITATDKK